ncbi:MAG: hypothetical protein ACRBM6_07350 [Geminicoccales bacterium]
MPAIDALLPDIAMHIKEAKRICGEFVDHGGLTTPDASSYTTVMDGAIEVGLVRADGSPSPKGCRGAGSGSIFPERFARQFVTLAGLVTSPGKVGECIVSANPNQGMILLPSFSG